MQLPNFTTAFFYFSELSYIRWLCQCKLLLTGEVKSVGEIPPPISWASCVEVAVPLFTCCLPVLVIDPGWIFGWLAKEKSHMSFHYSDTVTLLTTATTLTHRYCIIWIHAALCQSIYSYSIHHIHWKKKRN